MKCGDSFLFPLRTEEIAHLWIVLTNPDPEGWILVANITTVYSSDKDRADLTVCVNPGEHPFVTKLSYIFYREAMTKRISELEAEEKAGNLKMNAACSQVLTSMARAGIRGSKYCTKAIQRFYNERKEL
jgi:hypothetical protein